jgi:hypothetical protein
MHAIAESAKQPKVKKVKAQRLSGPANVHEGMKKEPVRQSARNRGKPAPVYNEIDSERGAKGHKGKGDGFAGKSPPPLLLQNSLFRCLQWFSVICLLWVRRYRSHSAAVGIC